MDDQAPHGGAEDSESLLSDQTSKQVIALSPESITSAQRRQLRAHAHSLRPVVQIGQAGLSEGVINATKEALEQHELIKVSINGEAPTERKQGAQDLAVHVGAHVIQVIGRVIILYRASLSKKQKSNASSSRGTGLEKGSAKQAGRKGKRR